MGCHPLECRGRASPGAPFRREILPRSDAFGHFGPPARAAARHPGDEFRHLSGANDGTPVARPAAPGTIESGPCTLTPPEYHHGMNAMSGTVVGGKIVAEGLSLPDGTFVTVLTPGDDLCIRLPSHLEQELLDAIDEADKEAGGAGLEFLEGLKRYE